jgi:hypothetical protein
MKSAVPPAARIDLASGLAGGFVGVGEDDGRAFSRRHLRVRETPTRACAGCDSDFSTYATHGFDSRGFGHARVGKQHLSVNVSGFNHL